VKIVDGDLVPVHHSEGDRIVDQVVADLAAGFVFGHRRGGREDELGPGLLETLDEGVEIFRAYCSGETATLPLILSRLAGCVGMR